MRHDLDPNSLEWHEHRLLHDNASEAAIVMDCRPDWMAKEKTIRQFWEEKQGLSLGDNKSNPFFEYGHEHEPDARRFVSNKLKVDLEPAIFSNGRYGASIDGYAEKEGGKTVKVEIKCPARKMESKTWQHAIADSIEDHYKWQMVHQDFVAPTDESYFFVYISDEINRLIPFESTKKDKDKLIAAWEKFHKTEPPPDFVTIENPLTESLVNDLKDLEAAKAKTEKDIKVVKAALEREANGQSIKAFGCTLKKIVRKGSVNYKAIKELEGVDLDQHRAEPTEYYKYTFDKENKIGY